MQRDRVEHAPIGRGLIHFFAWALRGASGEGASGSRLFIYPQCRQAGIWFKVSFPMKIIGVIFAVLIGVAALALFLICLVVWWSILAYLLPWLIGLIAALAIWEWVRGKCKSKPVVNPGQIPPPPSRYPSLVQKMMDDVQDVKDPTNETPADDVLRQIRENVVPPKN